MSFGEKLVDLAGALASATVNPDEYANPDHMSHEGNKADIIEL